MQYNTSNTLKIGGINQSHISTTFSNRGRCIFRCKSYTWFTIAIQQIVIRLAKYLASVFISLFLIKKLYSKQCLSLREQTQTSTMNFFTTLLRERELKPKTFDVFLTWNNLNSLLHVFANEQNHSICKWYMTHQIE